MKSFVVRKNAERKELATQRACRKLTSEYNRLIHNKEWLDKYMESFNR